MANTGNMIGALLGVDVPALKNKQMQNEIVRMQLEEARRNMGNRNAMNDLYRKSSAPTVTTSEIPTNLPSAGMNTLLETSLSPQGGNFVEARPETTTTYPTDREIQTRMLEGARNSGNFDQWSALKTHFSKLDDDSLKYAKEQIDVLSGGAIAGMNLFDDYVKKFKGDEDRARSAMQPYYETFRRRATELGVPSDKWPQSWDQGQAAVFTKGLDQVRVHRENELTSRGKGGSKTSFNQILDRVSAELGIKGEKAIELARSIYGQGKYSRQSAAVNLRKSGMSEAKINSFLDSLEAEQDTKPGKPASNNFPDAKAHSGRTIIEKDDQGKPTGKRFKSDGKAWNQVSKAGTVNLAMAPESVPLGSGGAGQMQDIATLQQQYQDALANDDFERAEQIKRQMQEMANSRRNMG